MLRKGCFILKDMTVKIVEDTLLGFPKRYGHYIDKNSNSIWFCDVMGYTSENLTLQLVDKNFEPPRGKVKSDAPIFYISLEQKYSDVLLKYDFRWKKWKRVFVSMISILCAVICLICLLYSILNPKFDAFVLLSLWIVEPVLLIVWAIKNKKHNDLTLIVFIQLLKKNFQLEYQSGDGSMIDNQK